MESVWDYPRPPRVEASPRRIRVVFDGVVIADTTRAFRVLETSHPPVYYIPPEDVSSEYLRPSRRRTWCEFKGEASYYDLVGRRPRGAQRRLVLPRPPPPATRRIRDHIAFYPGRWTARRSATSRSRRSPATSTAAGSRPT